MTPRFYGKHFAKIDLLGCLLIAVVGIALDRSGYFSMSTYLSDGSKSIYSALVGGILSALGFLVTAQSIIYTLTPESVIVRLQKSRGGKGLKQLRNLFVSTAVALALGLVLSALGYIIQQPHSAAIILGWIVTGILFYLAAKFTQTFWFISQIGRHRFEEE